MVAVRPPVGRLPPHLGVQAVEGLRGLLESLVDLEGVLREVPPLGQAGDLGEPLRVRVLALAVDLGEPLPLQQLVVGQPLA